MCQNCDLIEREKARVVDIALKHPQPCLVCEDTNVVGVGTWIADQEHYLAVGDRDNHVSVFGYWVCEKHANVTPENEKIITQIILQEVRSGNPRQV